MPFPPSAGPICGWYLIVLFFAALVVLNYGIPAYFGAMPMVERLGQAVCNWVFGI
jgi:hypothetical protein